MNGNQKALALFRLASKRVPAYGALLKKHRINPHNILNVADFKKLPIIDKNSYIKSYPLKDLFVDREIPSMAYASSGSSGEATFWFRNDEQEKVSGDIHERIFNKTFGIQKKDSTLVIICFSMGVWVAGNYTLASCREVSRRGYDITSITPGLEKEDIFYALKSLAPLFKNIILAGYPPFLMDILVETRKRNIRIPKRTYAITAGDKFTEQWRDSFLRLLNSKDPTQLISIYGSADAGVLGYETPLSIALRRLALKQKALHVELFDEETALPALVQYDPDQIFFESIGSELAFTVNTATPLVRYNIHDEGKILSREEIKKILDKYKLTRYIPRGYFDVWNFPFIVKKGRSDVAVTFYAINIYPENIKVALDGKSISKLVSGQFFAYNKDTNQNKSQKLFIQVELADGVQPKKKYLEAIRENLVETLRKVSIEYRKLYEIIGREAASPRLQLFPFGEADFQAKGGRGILNIRGKKARMVDSRP